MTKKQMIQNIQQLEATMFLQAKQLEFEYDREDSLYRSAIGKWLGVNQLMQDLGIKEDLTLPESREAVELICQIDRKTA